MFSILNKLTGRATPEAETPIGSPTAAAVSPAAASGAATDPIALTVAGHSVCCAAIVVTASGGGWNETPCAMAA